MAIEQQDYPALRAYPATGPLAGPAYPVDITARSVRVVLSGPSFVARVQVSNAITTGLPHLFVPPETTWDTVATLTPADPPLTVPTPARFIRLLLDSGTMNGGTFSPSSNDAGFSSESLHIAVTGLLRNAMAPTTDAVQLSDGSFLPYAGLLPLLTAPTDTTSTITLSDGSTITVPAQGDVFTTLPVQLSDGSTITVPAFGGN